MSNHENTANEKRDVYATVTAQIITAIENGVGNLAYALAHVRALCLQPDQRNQP